MKKLSTLLVLFFCFFLVPSLWAQNSYSDFERELELTEPQRIQIQGIRDKYIGAWRSVRSESMRKRLEMKELNKDPAANAGKIGRLQDEMRELDTARENIYNQYRSEISRTLNERQREQYNNFVDTEHKRMRRMRPDPPPRWYGR